MNEDEHQQADARHPTRQFISPRSGKRRNALNELLEELLRPKPEDALLDRQADVEELRDTLREQAAMLLHMNNAKSATDSVSLYHTSSEDMPPLSLDELHSFMTSRTPALIREFDAIVLGTFDAAQAEKEHVHTCIPCFLKFPRKEPPLIQLLYISRALSDDDNDFIPEQIAEKIAALQEQRERFFYALRFNFLQDLTKAERALHEFRTFPPPAEYYTALRDNQPEYTRLVALAESGKCSSATQDYIREKTLLEDSAERHFAAAYNQYMIMEMYIHHLRDTDK